MYRYLTVAPLRSGSVWESLATWYQQSWLCELLTYFEERYFQVDLGVYEHFSISADAASRIRIMILALTVGVILATVMAVKNRTVIGGFVRSLLHEQAQTPETAKTLLELGFFRSVAIRQQLRHGNALRGVVRCREEEEALAAAGEDPEAIEQARQAFRMDCNTMHYYIPEDLRYRAEIRYRQKGSGWGTLAITVPVMIIVAAVLCFVLPELIRFADNLIGFFSPK